MTARNATHRRLCGLISTSHEVLAESKSAESAAGLAAPTCSSGIRPMTECQRCGRETDRRTLAGEPLCAECAEWREDGQQGFGAFADPEDRDR
jgi:hypothetical protein